MDEQEWEMVTCRIVLVGAARKVSESIEEPRVERDEGGAGGGAGDGRG